MRLTCLRHGVTPLNLAHRFNGMSQEGITEPQREALAKIDFDHSAFDAIYCSNLNRTIETAKALEHRGESHAFYWYQATRAWPV